MRLDILSINPEKASTKLQDFIREYVKKLNRSGVALGLSGGLDSCVLAYLGVKAVGKENVHLVFMPEKDTSKETYKDVKLIEKTLDVKVNTINLSPLLRKAGTYRFALNLLLLKTLKEYAVRKKFESYQQKYGYIPFAEMTLGSNDKLLNEFSAYYRIKHRMRMVMLYQYAEKNNLLVLGAANKTEALTGYFVKFGIDHCTDLMPLVSLYKTQVRQLGEHLKIPEKILKKAPIPDLAPGIKDEAVLDLDYEKVDLILYGLEHKISIKQLCEQLNLTEDKVRHIQDMQKASWHMRNYSLSCNI